MINMWLFSQIEMRSGLFYGEDTAAIATLSRPGPTPLRRTPIH